MERAFEYLDHTADVQIHAWGPQLEGAFLNAALGVYNYMTPLEGVAEKAVFTFEAEGHDVESLLLAFLDECLFQFHTEFRVCRTLKVVTFERAPWRIVVEGRGEIFDRARHEAGTEVKAITYSAMTVLESAGYAELYVIVDI